MRKTCRPAATVTDDYSRRDDDEQIRTHFCGTEYINTVVELMFHYCV